MTSNGPSVSSDLSKLTVPQLKALCKERRIIGYSKLAKAALLQKLAEAAAPTKTTSSPKANPSVTEAIEAPSTPRVDEARNPAYIQSSTTYREGNVAKVVHQPSTGPTEISTAKALLPTGTQLPESPQNRIVASARETSTKRPAHIDFSAPSKRIRTSPTPATNAPPKLPVSTSTFQGAVPVDSSVFKVPALPLKPPEPLVNGPSMLAKEAPNTKHSVVPRQIAGAGRFKALVPSTPKPVGPDHANRQPSRAPEVSVTPRCVDSAVNFNFHATPLPVLLHISFPPKASERKWVYQWAVILSALSPADRQTCTLVSRTFRYAVYLSAAHILLKDYTGRRLDVLLKLHPRNMTNFWPYLRLRRAEVSRRRHVFEQSFLGQYTRSMGCDPLSVRLWAGPDDEKQVDVALRFVLTRMWFAVSVGAYGHDASAWSKSTVQDVREVVKGEIWQVIARDVGTGDICNFYVLEATCEVIGRPPSSQPGEENTLGYRLRADWTTWVSQRSQGPPTAGPCSLLECVKWSNTEDYHRGISKAWLHRVQDQNADSIAKRGVAEKYILASVVANGISGQWMSTSAMAQEFSGLPGTGNAIDPRTAARSSNTVNMYLAAHHHIESVHFTTSKGEALHGGVAIVQTPGREYYVLRDNGMQVGCEEEGIPKVWQEIIGCDILGRVRAGRSS